jgi:hypothetical protein
MDRLTLSVCLFEFESLTSVSTLALYGRSWQAELLAQGVQDGRQNIMRNINSRAFVHIIHESFVMHTRSRGP